MPSWLSKFLAYHAQPCSFLLICDGSSIQGPTLADCSLNGHYKCSGTAMCPGCNAPPWCPGVSLMAVNWISCSYGDKGSKHHSGHWNEIQYWSNSLLTVVFG